MAIENPCVDEVGSVGVLNRVCEMAVEGEKEEDNVRPGSAVVALHVNPLHLLIGGVWHVRLLRTESVGDERLAVKVVRCVEGLVGSGFKVRNRGIEFAGDDLFGGGGGVAEFTGGEIAFFRARGRTEGSAEDRAVLVEVTGAGGEIENGTGFVVGELFEEFGGLLILVEGAGRSVAREPRVEACERSGDSCADSFGARGIGLGELLESIAQAGGVLLRNGEDADAALRATRTADQVRAAAESGGGESGVDDLDEVLFH